MVEAELLYAMETKNFFWLTVLQDMFYCVVWNQTCNISEVCLYIWTLSGNV